MVDKRYITIKPNELFTKCHMLDYLERVTKARVSEIMKEFGQHDFKIHKMLQRLMAQDMVSRKEEKFKNHKTYFYCLTPYAQGMKIKLGLYTWMQKENNPFYATSERIVQKYMGAQQRKIGNETRFIPAKELVGFR
jgi:predicted transcriptional regulator